MRAAPSVYLHCGSDRAWRCFQGLSMGLGVLSLCYWALCWWVEPGWPAALTALAAAVPAAVLAARAVGMPGGYGLTWDGAGWQLGTPPGAPSPVACDVALVFDLGSWLLLRVRPQAPRRIVWLAVSARAAGAAWHGLRVALHARPGAAQLPRGRAAAEPPP